MTKRNVLDVKWISAAFVLPLLAGCAGISDAVDAVDDPGAEASEVTCTDLAEEAVRISEEGDGFVTLLKVRNPAILKDHRDSYAIPTGGSGESLILSCRGVGVWSDGDHKTEVKLTLTVDSDGDQWVFYKPVA